MFSKFLHSFNAHKIISKVAIEQISDLISNKEMQVICLCPHIPFTLTSFDSTF